ncbi:LysR substrate-binding domain-containing protein [Secundilactobacillus similis]|uniref:LysR substrate-binding domain-containing protein n=1 Tax=Secundilactobacillus similis TaxID=414682 RepID=UPI000A73D05C|nr:LysR substrate-binding domain-containing protein [Secundilactobacillus similis]
MSQSTSATLRIGFTTSFESIVADELLTPFQKQFPQTNLFPVQQTYQQSREGLLNQTVDVVIAVDYGIGHLLSEAFIKQTVYVRVR